MATLNIVTTDLTTLNRTKIDLFLDIDRIAVLDTLVYSAPHPQRQWTFLNLDPSTAYYLRWTEIDGSGLDIQTLADAVITMPAAGSIAYKPDQEIIVDVTTGWTGGQTVVVLDGTAGTDDWRTWDIHIEKVGFGSQFTTENYTWDKVTGTLTLTDALSSTEKYYVEFQPQVLPSPPAIGNSLFTGSKTFTTDSTILASDFGKNLILIEGGTDYLEITLPPIATVVNLRPLHIKTSRVHHKCAKIISSDGTNINWLSGLRANLYMGICESFTLFRLGSTWEIINPDGNFKTVGERVSEFAGSAIVLNKIPLDGTICNIQAQARLYYDYVDLLPMGEKVTYALWSTGTNKYKYSLPDGSGNFHVPDLRNLTERQTDGTRLPGDYQGDQVGESTVTINLPTGDSFNGHPYAPTAVGKGLAANAPVSLPLTVTLNTGLENITKNYASRVYVRV